ncbi:hypothetical protein QQS45_00020 [Alteriqipengyuania flavescens]|uniref:phage tail tube protein n=1 Tax=Alteriqipengyuania flavescens TaxID=3053610 RepID=UPI0025B43636|nr:phage tail tube protein [Alteriqipengyuania flavescens]WJY18675.1 hypothetical protein QQW98_00020 [Alteriqipengyuania flavescens]WJY24615.1 hypothetical protein QQS45_00020 [Alteriqipengyuania flavescens]
MVDTTRVIAAKTEATYGTDAAPTLAANAILTRNYSSTPLEVDQVQRNLDTRKFGASRQKPSNARYRSAYEVELAGSGAAGTAPKWMTLLAAAGMKAANVTAGQKAEQVFAQVGDPSSSLTEYAWTGDQLRKSVGQRGTFSLDFTAGALPFAGLQFTGLVPAAAPRSQAAPGAADFTGWIEPVEVNNENSLFTLDGFGAVTRSLRIEAGRNVALRSLVGARYIKGGNHQATARVVIEAPGVAAKDYLAALATGDLVAWSFVHGKTAGNIVEASGTKAQITSIGETEEDDVLMFDIGLLLTVDGGADDLVLTAK